VNNDLTHVVDHFQRSVVGHLQEIVMSKMPLLARMSAKTLTEAEQREIAEQIVAGIELYDRTTNVFRP
jgi:hypothetical protein